MYILLIIIVPVITCCSCSQDSLQSLFMKYKECKKKYSTAQTIKNVWYNKSVFIVDFTTADSFVSVGVFVSYCSSSTWGFLGDGFLQTQKKAMLHSFVIYSIHFPD